MNKLFKITVLFLIVSISLFAQNPIIDKMQERRVVFDKSFSADEGTTLVMNVGFTVINIKESNNGKINIRYEMGFNKYRKKTIDDLVKHQKIEATQQDNIVTFTTINKTPAPNIKYEWEELFNKKIATAEKELNNASKVNHKSKDSLLKEINETDWELIKRIKRYTDNPTSKNKKPNVRYKYYVSYMVVEIPPFVNLKIDSENSQLTFEDDLINLTEVSSKNSKLKFEEIDNELNSFFVDGGTFTTNEISRGQYKFSNVRSVKIGAIDEASIESEFSKIEIGEIKRELYVNDFNSEYNIYNWSDEFEELSVDSRYSKWHFFLPENGYKLSLIGENNKVFEKLDAIKEIEINNYDPNWLYTDSKLYGSIDGDFSNSIIYNYKDF